MCARANRPDDLFGLGRGKNELHMRRRFLNQLQQCIEALVSDHVCLIDDEDLEAIPHRSETGLFPKLSRVIDATVRRRIKLHHVQ